MPLWLNLSQTRCHYLQVGVSAGTCRYPAAESFMRPNGSRPKGWRQSREALGPCHLTCHRDLWAHRSMWRGRGISGGEDLGSSSACWAQAEDKECPPAAPHLCAEPRCLGKQGRWLKADFPFQGEFGSCSVLQLILTGISCLISVFHVMVKGSFHYGPFIIHIQQRGF